MMKLILIFAFISVVTCSNSTETDTGHRVTHTMWFEITIGNRKIPERIVIGLFGKAVPMTVENFVTLAQRPKGHGFKGSMFHFSNKKEFIAGGHWLLINNRFQGRSAFNYPEFDDENHRVKHYGAGWVSSDPEDRNEHTSRFVITLKKVPRLDKTSCVVFGKILSGMPIVKRIARLPTNGFMLDTNVIISDCGAGLVDPPFFVPKNDAID